MVTSYGPEEIDFKEIRKNKDFLPAFIKYRAMMRYTKAKREAYDNIGLPENFRAWEMLPREGFGYILISNPSDKTIEMMSWRMLLYITCVFCLVASTLIQKGFATGWAGCILINIL